MEQGKIVFYRKTFNSIWPCLALQVMTEDQHQHSHSGHASLFRVLYSIVYYTILDCAKLYYTILYVLSHCLQSEARPARLCTGVSCKAWPE